MNYSVELWDSYNKVENNLLFHLRGLKDFIYMLRELNKSVKNFSDSLKKVYDMNLSITTNESLYIGIENFRNFLFLHHNFLEKFISNLISETINPLNTLQETLLKKLNSNYKETTNAEKNYDSYITQIDFTRNKFHSRAKQVENKLIELEISRINNKDNNNEEQKENQENKDKKEIFDINKLDEDTKNIIGFAKDSEKIYLSYIKYTNRIQEEFIEIKKKNLNEIQSLEIELGEKIKNCLNKYYKLQSNFCTNLNDEIEKNIKLLEKIDINNDIQIYIKNNNSKGIPPFKFDYVPYICTLDKQNIFNDDEKLKNINMKVKEQIKQLFPEEKDISILKTKTDKDVENFIDSILKGQSENVINANEENLKIVSSKNLRRIFLKYLNKLRNSTHIILNDLSFKIFGNLLKEGINYSYKEKDFASIKLIMVIATNLFKINKVSHKPRVFLHNYLINNPIWKDFNFWQSLIKFDIVEEMHNQKKYSLFMEENDILKNIRIRDIVKSKLNANIYNMVTFEVNTLLMDKIILYFTNFYKLQKNVLDSLNKVINNSKSKRIELKETKKINNSFDLALFDKKINKRNKNKIKNSNNNITVNNSKKSFLSLDKEIKMKKISNIIEPVKQDEEKITDCFKEIDKEINNKKNIFKDENYNNILIMESKNKKDKETDTKENKSGEEEN